jgi:hypothetical protein
MPHDRYGRHMAEKDAELKIFDLLYRHLEQDFLGRWCKWPDHNKLREVATSITEKLKTLGVPIMMTTVLQALQFRKVHGRNLWFIDQLAFITNKGVILGLVGGEVDCFALDGISKEYGLELTSQG